jgi:hypothetical protein
MTDAIEYGFRIQEKPRNIDHAPKWVTEYMPDNPMELIRDLEAALAEARRENGYRRTCGEHVPVEPPGEETGK